MINPDSPMPSTQDNYELHKSNLSVGRRVFLKGLLGISAVATIDSWSTIESDTDTSEGQNDTQSSDSEANSSQQPTSQSGSSTTVATSNNENSRFEESRRDRNSAEEDEDGSNIAGTANHEHSRLNPLFGPIKYLDDRLIEDGSLTGTAKTSLLSSAAVIAGTYVIKGHAVKK